MAQKKERIRYTYSELPLGGQVQITTTAEEALRAIHEFLAFQRQTIARAGTHISRSPAAPPGSRLRTCLLDEAVLAGPAGF
jgi:hypothetical protein